VRIGDLELIVRRAARGRGKRKLDG
jgi:hypothetical protein